MDKQLETENILACAISNPMDEPYICQIGRALSVPERIKILRELQFKPKNLAEISNKLSLPISSVSNHINILEEARLVQIEYKPAKKGHMKLCSTANIKTIISLTEEQKNETNHLQVEMPVGLYSECKTSKAYLVGSKGFIFREQSSTFMLFTPERINGQLFSFQTGSVTYCFPNLYKFNPIYRNLSFTFEMCSEAPYYRENWPSDITVWINGVEIATFRCPGDFGGKRGKYTPEFWQTNSTQFGLLKKFSIDDNGCYIDDIFNNRKHCFDDLNLKHENSIKLTIGMKDNAEHKGGINIFGKGFGNYPQDIVMMLTKHD